MVTPEHRGRIAPTSRTGPALRRRLALFYGALVAATAAVLALVMAIGSGEHSARSIAGGYDIVAGQACLGSRVDFTQSGQFIGLSNAQGTVGGKLRFQGTHLTGTVSCSTGAHSTLDATLRGLAFGGSLGGRPVALQFKRDPPPPGALKPRVPGSMAGTYATSPTSPCLGGKLTFQGGSPVTLSAVNKTVRGTLRYDNHTGALSGSLTCADGTPRSVTGQVADRTVTLRLTPPPASPPRSPPASGTGSSPGPGSKGVPALTATPPTTALANRAPTTAPANRASSPAATSATAAVEEVVANKSRSFDNTMAAFFIATVIVMLAARLLGAAITRIGQPRVMGEVLAGILLGPTLLGAISPSTQAALFPTDIVPLIGVAANLGLIFYMFLVGLEVDVRQLRGRVLETAAISNSGVLVPLMGGLLIALPTYTLVGPGTSFAPFALFLGVAMSITAFPVLARIIVERHMLGHPIGALALAAAAVDDVSAWFLVAVATAVAAAGSATGVIKTVAFSAAFALTMVFGVRPLLARASVAFEEAGRVPGAWITAIFAGVLLSAFTTEHIGIALIFGAFVMGAVMPRHAGLTEDITRRVEDFVVTLLLPLFFAYTGLRTNVGLLDRGQLVWILLALIGIAIVGKFGGAVLAARVVRMGWREAAVIGTLMNTRGLTELIVLNLALEKGFMSPALFTALVIMALVTTFMAGPLLRLVDPARRFSTQPEQELEKERRRAVTEAREPLPAHSVLVAPQSDRAIEQLVALAEPLARGDPPRELILVRLLQPPRATHVRGGLQTERRALGAASDALEEARGRLVGERVPARALAFTSVDPGPELVRLASAEGVDVILLDGRRPLLGQGVPRGSVGTVLDQAPCDVAVLVAREDQAIEYGPDRPVLVPFGGAQHDWAAVELAAWIAGAKGATLRLLGAAGPDGRDPQAMLADTALLLQRFVSVSAEPVIAPPGREGVLDAAAGAGLLVIGLSERWRREGLGPTRAAIAQAAPAPILFVRRGARPGALAARADVTGFTWSRTTLGAAPPV